MLEIVVVLALVVGALMMKVRAQGQAIDGLRRAVWRLSGGQERAVYEAKWDSVRSEFDAALDEEEAAMAKEAKAR